MAYIVEPLLGTLRDEITSGMANGSLQRFGGIIRIAKGHPGAGQIVTHLRDVISIGAQVPGPASIVQAASSMVANVQLHQISTKLSQVMQLTQVAASASVLNLGVSAVGFLVMNHKLNKLQESVGRLESSVAELRADVSHRLDEIQRTLVEIHYLTVVNVDLAREALAGLEAIRAELFHDKMAMVMSWANRLDRATQPDERLLDDAIHAFDQVRLSLQAGLGMRALGPGNEPLWADELMRYRLWCATSSAEVMAMRRADQTGHAARLAQDVAAKSRSLAQRWQHTLMPASELGGVFRFGHSRFESEEPVPLETRRRLARLQKRDELDNLAGLTDAELHAAETETALEVAHALPSLPENWFSRQRAAASVLDFAEETTERLESIADEMALCDRKRLRFAQWEGLLLPSTDAELGLIRQERKAA